MEENNATVKISITFENGEKKEFTFKEAFQIYRQLHQYFGKNERPAIHNQPSFLVDGHAKYNLKPEVLENVKKPEPSVDPWRPTFK